MKNKLSSIILLLYTLLIILFSFSNQLISNIVLTIVSKIGFNDINLWYNIINYAFIFIVYFGYSITLTIVCIEYFKSFRYILIYSIVLNILTIVVATLIKSFYISIDFINILVSLIATCCGIVVQILVKIKQIKGGKYEE